MSQNATAPFVLWLALLLAGCPASSEEVRPPSDQFFFPTGSALLADESVLFVINANSDLRYDSGTLSAVSVDLVEDIANEWLTTGEPPALDCEADSVIPHTLVCNEKEVLLEDFTVRTGNFATEVDIQELDDGRSRLFLAVRGDPSLTWIDFDPTNAEIDCGVSGSYPRCDQSHRLVNLLGDVEVGALTSEPFGVYVDSQNEYVVLTHLVSGAVSLADAPRDGAVPMLTDEIGGVFAGDAVTQVAGAVGAAGRLPGSRGDRIYVTSRSEERVQVFTVARPGDSGIPALVPAEYFFLRGVEPSDDSRSIAFSESGERAYVVNRSPPMVQMLDTRLDETGVPRNQLVAAVEVCGSASDLAVGDTGRGDRVYVACFRDGQVWSIDPASAGLESIINVGRGPQSLSLSTSRQLLFVTNFLEDTVAVIDLRPESSTENRVILKLGRTRQSGGN